MYFPYINFIMTPLALPPPTITITSQGDSAVGENYTLVCTAFILQEIAEDVLLSAFWSSANRHPSQREITTVYNATASSVLYFSPVRASLSGQYTCNVSVTVPELSLVKMFSHTYDVIVQRN